MSEFQKPNTEDEESKKPNTPPALPLMSRVKSDPILWKKSFEISDMLSYCRPHQSRTEAKFIAKYIVPFKVKFDKKGNAYKIIGDNPNVLWSSHVDTVHNKAGYQKIQYFIADKTGDLHFEVRHGNTKWADQSSCLGADDTCGVWLMMEMIRAQIPGLYIFHRGEECGGIGSKWIAENNKEALANIKFAIAFDRRGEKSIITYQRSEKSCSDEFAKSLAEQLGMGHQPDDTGMWTDTASYVDLIPECTNVSVGYDNAHSRNEYTNIDYLFRLRDALVKIDTTKLVEARKPGDNARKPYVYSGGYYGQYDWETDGWTKHSSGYWIKKKKNRKKEDGVSGIWLREKNKGKDWMEGYEWDSDFALWFPKVKKAKSNGTTFAEATKLIKENPAAIADLLEQNGYSPNSIKDYLIEIGLAGQETVM